MVIVTYCSLKSLISLIRNISVVIKGRQMCEVRHDVKRSVEKQTETACYILVTDTSSSQWKISWPQK